MRVQKFFRTDLQSLYAEVGKPLPGPLKVTLEEKWSEFDKEERDEWAAALRKMHDYARKGKLKVAVVLSDVDLISKMILDTEEPESHLQLDCVADEELMKNGTENKENKEENGGDSCASAVETESDEAGSVSEFSEDEKRTVQSKQCQLCGGSEGPTGYRRNDIRCSVTGCANFVHTSCWEKYDTSSQLQESWYCFPHYASEMASRVLRMEIESVKRRPRAVPQVVEEEPDPYSALNEGNEEGQPLSIYHTSRANVITHEDRKILKRVKDFVIAADSKWNNKELRETAYGKWVAPYLGLCPNSVVHMFRG